MRLRKGEGALVQWYCLWARKSAAETKTKRGRTLEIKLTFNCTRRRVAKPKKGNDYNQKTFAEDRKKCHGRRLFLQGQVKKKTRKATSGGEMT